MANNLKIDFDNILRQYGHDVFLQRRSQSTAGDVTYSETLERHTTRFTLPTTRALPNAQQEEMFGLTNTSERVYYFRSEVNPFEGDRIYEAEVRTPNGQSVWSVDQAIGLRGLNGEIIYWAVGVTRIEPN